MSTFENYIAVDFQFGAVMVLRFSVSHKELIKVGEFSASTIPNSKISPSAFCCSTFYSNKLVIWNINTSSQIEKLEFDDEIVIDTFFNRNTMWCVTNKKAYYLTINGSKIVEHSFPLEAVSAAKCCNNVLVGLVNWSIDID